MTSMVHQHSQFTPINNFGLGQFRLSIHDLNTNMPNERSHCIYEIMVVTSESQLWTDAGLALMLVYL